MTKEAKQVQGAAATSIEIVRTETIEGWPVGFGSDEEPRIRDLDLGERLGCARADEARELVKRMITAGKLSDSEVFRRSLKTGPRGGRPGSEYWLTEEQALLVATQSGTEAAWALTREIVRVYMLARRGQIQIAPPQAIVGPSNEALHSLVVGLYGVVEELRGQLARAHTPGVLTYDQRLTISREVRSLAEGREVLGYSKDRKSAESWINARIVSAAQWGGTGANRRNMPADRYGLVMACLEQIKADLEAEAQRRVGRHVSGRVALQRLKIEATQGTDLMARLLANKPN